MKLYVIRYGKQFKYGTLGTVFCNAENPNEQIEDFSFLYYLAEHNGAYLLFDTGFRDEKLAENMGISLLNINGEIQQVFGEMPRIKTIVLTHSHWDHINNIDLYPESEIILASKAYETAMESGTEAVKARLSKRINRGAVWLVEEECTIDEKFFFQVIGGHTSDSAVITFEDQGRVYCITGDECYTCENMRRNIPIGIASDHEKNSSFLSVANARGWIPLPFHDVSVLSDYEQLTENISRII